MTEATEHADVVRAEYEAALTDATWFQRRRLESRGRFVAALDALVLLASRVPQLETERDEAQAGSRLAHECLDKVMDERDAALDSAEAAEARVKELEAAVVTYLDKISNPMCPPAIRQVALDNLADAARAVLGRGPA